MKYAYDKLNLYNLMLLKEVKQWKKSELISQEQVAAITQAYPSVLYHPNIIIRILIFLAALLGISGVTGMLALMFADAGEDAIAVLCVLYGGASLFVLDRVVIHSKQHYKSGLTEALLYHSMGFIIGGLSFMIDFEMRGMLWISLFVGVLAAYRYIDMISTVAALLLASYLLFDFLYEMGGAAQQLIPVVFVVAFVPVYFLVKKLQRYTSADAWENCLLICESYALLMMYAAGNYFVVRELSVNLMNLNLEAGQDIPLAWLFYLLTVVVPLLYLYVGIRHKDIVILRVSLVVIAFSAFTFKYYYSLGHPEITLTLAGAVLIAVSISLMHYLRKSRNGFTRENILTEKWTSMNAEAFIVSQTLGGNKGPEHVEVKTEGGSFGGGGASGDY